MIQPWMILTMLSKPHEAAEICYAFPDRLDLASEQPIRQQRQDFGCPYNFADSSPRLVASDSWH